MKLALALLSVVTLAAAQGEEGGCPLGEGCENMACQADITGLAGTPDGIVNVEDMLVVLANFKCYTLADADQCDGADLSGENDSPDGMVNVLDILFVLKVFRVGCSETGTGTGPSPPPPVNCAGGWGGWGSCSETCGGGTQSRSYSVTTAASGGGAACPAAQNRNCNTAACAVNCVGSWGGWGSCSETCGGGTQSRTYSVTTSASGGGAACPAAQNRGCNNDACGPPPPPPPFCVDASTTDGERIPGQICAVMALTDIGTDFGLDTWEFAVTISSELASVYTIFGDSDNPVVLPAAWNHPLGVNLGGVSPLLLTAMAGAGIPELRADSWITIGITGGDAGNAVSVTPPSAVAPWTPTWRDGVVGTPITPDGKVLFQSSASRTVTCDCAAV